LAWTDGNRLQLSLRVDTPRIVSRTKRRDREERFSVGFCDQYAYSASGLVALFIAQLKIKTSGRAAEHVEIEMAAYPERPHSAAIASRLFSPLGYTVRTEGGKLSLAAKKSVGEALRELQIMLLVLDRRTRLFLSE